MHPCLPRCATGGTWAAALHLSLRRSEVAGVHRNCLCKCLRVKTAPGRMPTAQLGFPGTYFYHGHYGMQMAAGLYGSLIVDVADGEEEPFKDDGELNLLLSDCYHESIYNQMVGLSSSPMRWIGEPQIRFKGNSAEDVKVSARKAAST